MANETTEEIKTTGKSADKAKAYEVQAPAGFEKINIDRPAYQPENFLERIQGTKREIYAANGPILQGLLAAFVTFKDVVDEQTGDIRAVSAYVVRLTAPTKAFERVMGSVDGKMVDVPAGADVLLWPNARLDQALEAACGVSGAKAANHPTHMVEFWLRPIGRDPFKAANGEDRRMWNFDVRAKPQPVPRKGTVALNILGGVSAPALPQVVS